MNKSVVGMLVAGAVAVLLAFPALAVNESQGLAPGAAAPDFTATASLAGKDFTFSLKQALAAAAPGGGIAFDSKFFVKWPAPHRPHQVRLEGGDCSSDSYCYP